MFNRKNFLLFGIVVGTAVGVAFAPRRGSDLRKELMDEFKKGGMGEKVLRETAVAMGKDIAHTAVDIYNSPKVQTKIEKGKKEALKLYENAKKNFIEKKDYWVESAREYIENAREEVEEKMRNQK